MSRFYLSLCFLFICMRVIAQSNEVQGSFIVWAKDNIKENELESVCETSIHQAFEIKRLIPNYNIFSLQLSNATLVSNKEIIKQLYATNQFKHVQSNHTVELRNALLPNDQYFANQWALNNTGQSGGTVDADIDAPEAWNIANGAQTQDSRDIYIAVIDVGIDIAHPDFNWYSNNYEIANNGIDDDSNGYIDDVRGWNTNLGNDNITSGSHGTHVAGIACAKANNTIGVAGVTWGAKCLPIVLTSADEAKVISAYGYALTQRKLYNETNGTKGFYVVATNSSFGISNAQPQDYPIWCSFYDELGKQGILSIVATTNANVNVGVTGDMPSLCSSEYVIVVTSSDANDNFANTGYNAEFVDITAPGAGIYSTLPNSSYGNNSGTSMATPHVTGAVAMVYSALPSSIITNSIATPRRVAELARDIILTSVDVKPSFVGKVKTNGRLNLYNATSNANSICTTFGAIKNDSVFYPVNTNIIFESVVNNATSVEWRINNAIVSTQQNFSYNFSSTGNYWLKLKTINGSCVFYDSVFIHVLLKNDANITLLEPMTNDCIDTISPKIKIKNEGFYAIHQIEMEVLVNSNFRYNHVFNGNVASGDSVYYSLPSTVFALGTNIIDINVIRVNTVNDDNMTNNLMSKNITMTNDARVSIELKTDIYPSETTIDITNVSSGNIVYSLGGLTLKNHYQKINLCLPPACYHFSIRDVFLDGICCNNGDGYYNLYANDVLIKSGGNFTSVDSITFCVEPNFTSVEDVFPLQNKILLKPNPCYHNLFIYLYDFENKNYYFIIQDITGRIVMTKPASEQNEIDVRQWSSGVYNVLLMNNEEGIKVQSKFVKK